MALKKVNFKEDEEALFDNAVIYKRGEYWHMRMWLPKEHKYARFSLKTRNKSTARNSAKNTSWPWGVAAAPSSQRTCMRPPSVSTTCGSAGPCPA
jgi:hypothetical protein